VRLRIRTPGATRPPSSLLPAVTSCRCRTRAGPTAFVGIAASLCTIAECAGTAYFLNDLATSRRIASPAGATRSRGMSSRQRVLVLACCGGRPRALARLAAHPADRRPAAVELALFRGLLLSPVPSQGARVLGVIMIRSTPTPACDSPVLHLRSDGRRALLAAGRVLVGLGVWQVSLLGLRNHRPHQLQDYRTIWPATV